MADRPNRLPPTLRPKSRYIAYQVISEKKLPFTDMMNAMWHSVLNFLGETGSSRASVWIIKNAWEEEKQVGLLRCNHTSVEEVRAALSLVQRVGYSPVIVRVLGISGTIKAARKKFFGERDLMSFSK